MALVQMDIQTLVIGGGPDTSLLVLKPRHTDEAPSVSQLPIQIGTVEAMAIGMGVDPDSHAIPRPLTHDLLANTITALGGTLSAVCIEDVSGTTFFATLDIKTADGHHVSIDSRPSDAIALAVRSEAPIFVSTDVLETASYPDFIGVKRAEERSELDEFHHFMETISPEDFKDPML